MSRQSSQPTSPQPAFTSFMTQVKDAAGKTTSVATAQPLCEQSFGVDLKTNTKMFASIAVYLELLGQNPFKVKVRFDGEEAPDPDSDRVKNYLQLNLPTMNMIALLGGFVIPQSNANNTTVATIPRFPFFKMIQSYDLSIILDAVMRGEEGIALQAITENPRALLQKGKVKNSVDVEYEITPLQAAVMANDVQLIEKMKEHFARLTTDLKGNPIDGLVEMKAQLIEIYRISLKRYCDIQLEKINEWKKQASEGQWVAHIIAQEEGYLKQYQDALENDDLEQLVNTHHQAQEHNAFDFQPYIDAICNAPEAELDEVIELINADTEEKTQAAIAKGVSPIEIGFIKDGRAYTREEVQALPFSELTLLQKMNRLREKLSECRREEIISNSHHTMKSGELNDHIWDEVDAGRVVDLDYKKRSIIFSQVYDFAQVTEGEAVRQDLRQGPYFLTKENPEPHRRLSNFNYLARADYRDASLVDRSSLDGWGYKFAAGRYCGVAFGTLVVGGGRPLAGFLQNLCRAKTASFQNLLRSLCEHASASLNIRV